MNYTLERKDKTSGELTVILDVNEINKFKKDALNKIKLNANVPGFRKGKVPSSFLEQKFNHEIKMEVAKKIFESDIIEKIAKDEKLYSYRLMKIIDVDLNERKSKAFMEFLPEFVICDYKNFEIKKEKVNVNDEDIMSFIKTEYEKKSPEVEVTENEVAKIKDLVEIDYEGFLDGVAFEGGKGANQSLKLGSKTFIPGFEEKILGHKKDEEFEIDVKFPDDYPKDTLQGKSTIFKIKLNKISRKDEIVLNDEYAQKNEYKDLNDMQLQIREKLEREEGQRVNDEFIGGFLKLIKEKSEIFVSNEFIEENIKEKKEKNEKSIKKYNITLDIYLAIQNSNREIYENELKTMAINDLKDELIFENVAESENLKATNEEIEKQLEEVALESNMKKEELLKILKKNKTYANFVASISYEIRMKKVIDFFDQHYLTKEDVTNISEVSKEDNINIIDN